MLKMIRVVIAILLITSFNINAIESSNETIELKHPSYEEPFVFNVSLPFGYRENEKRKYLMMFDFHPHSNTYLSGMHDWLSHNGEWPWLKTIIVSPKAGNRVGMLFDPSGETTPMLDFFEDRLFPLVDKKYRTNGFRIFSGFRVNGTIVLSSLINKPNLFNAHIAVSPELKDDYAAILSTSGKKLRQLNDKPRFLLFSHGTNVKEEHQQSSYEALKLILEEHAPASLEWYYEHFDDNYFMSLPLLSVITGIEKIFDDIHQGLAPTSEIASKGIDSITEHYEYLSKQKYGFEVSPTTSINELGFYLLKTEPQKGLEVFKTMVERFPDSPFAHHNLATGYAEIGDFEAAVLQEKKAIALSKNTATWYQKQFQKQLDEFQNKQSNQN